MNPRNLEDHTPAPECRPHGVAVCLAVSVIALALGFGFGVAVNSFTYGRLPGPPSSAGLLFVGLFALVGLAFPGRAPEWTGLVGVGPFVLGLLIRLWVAPRLGWYAYPPVESLGWVWVGFAIALAATFAGWITAYRKGLVSRLRGDDQ
jgi:hypothetical protein